MLFPGECGARSYGAAIRAILFRAWGRDIQPPARKRETRQVVRGLAEMGLGHGSGGPTVAGSTRWCGPALNHAEGLVRGAACHDAIREPHRAGAADAGPLGRRGAGGADRAVEKQVSDALPKGQRTNACVHQGLEGYAACLERQTPESWWLEQRGLATIEALDCRDLVFLGAAAHEVAQWCVRVPGRHRLERLGKLPTLGQRIVERSDLPQCD
mmetsp:Transcript_51121/g.165489  ORF Transcript_51121/g.165489 Transcript_51121/m.165489 type:complete len:213 (+) Transcript_51121:597-1235(+)